MGLVNLAIPKSFSHAIKEVENFDGHLVKLTIISTDRTIQFFTSYTSYGRFNAVKYAFWQLIDTKTSNSLRLPKTTLPLQVQDPIAYRNTDGFTG